MGAARKKPHYAWAIVVACVAFYAVPVGMIGNCAGVYVTPVMEQFGWTRTEAMLFMSLQQLTAALVTPVAGKVLARCNPRWVFTATSLIFGLSSLSCAWFTEPWQWDLYGITYGACGGFFLFLGVPTIINRWFARRNGLAIGIASTGIGVLGALCNPLTQTLITAYGWQTARIIMSLACTVVSVGLTALLLRPSPQSMGILPYGADDPVAPAAAVRDGQRAEGASGSGSLGAAAPTIRTVTACGATVAQAVRSPALYLLMLVAGGFCFCATFLQQIASFCATGPLGAKAGAVAVSIAMVGSIIGKPLLGWLADRIGAVPTGILAGVAGAAGMTLAFFSGDNVALFYAGIGVFGLGYSALSIVSPLLGSQGFGRAHFSEIYSYVCTAISLFGASATVVYAWLYDATGNFTTDFVVVIAVYILIAALCPVVVRLAQRTWRAGGAPGADADERGSSEVAR